LSAMGIPSQRGLAVFASAAAEALLVRACPGVGMVRFGTFDVANGPELDSRNGRTGPSPGDSHLVASLVTLVGEGGGAAGLLHNACFRSALLAARWAALGVVHGMLDTDNIHVGGVAIDVASTGFIGTYYSRDEARGPAAAHGRYCYQQQSAAVLWGLRRLAAALSRGTKQLSEEEASSIVENFPRLYRTAWLREMRRKLGIAEVGDSDQEDADRSLVDRLFHTMEKTFCDFTATFRCLMPPRPEGGKDMIDRLAAFGAPLPSADFRAAELRARARRVRPIEPRERLEELAKNAVKLAANKAQVQKRIAQRMAQHIEADTLEKAAQAADASDPLQQYASDLTAWDLWLAEYGTRCSLPGGVDDSSMAQSNPKFVPRAWAVDAAAVAAENGDFAPAQRLVDLLPHAFDEMTDFGELILADDPRIEERVIQDPPSPSDDTRSKTGSKCSSLSMLSDRSEMDWSFCGSGGSTSAFLHQLQ